MTGPPDRPDGPRPASGLRNPPAAVRGVAMATLVLEAVVLLLALRPVDVLGGGISPLALGTIGGLAVACLGVCGLLRRPWGWQVGTVLQVAITLTGVFQWAMFVLGAIFLALWLAVLRLRVTVAGPARFDH